MDMSAVADRIMKRVRGKGCGWVFTPKQFVDFGTRGSVDMALSRLAHAGDIRRIGRGLYDYPRQHDKLGALSPDPGQLAQALSAQRSEEHTSELQSLMRISYAVFCLKKKNTNKLTTQ